MVPTPVLGLTTLFEVICSCEQLHRQSILTHKTATIPFPLPFPLHIHTAPPPELTSNNKSKSYKSHGNGLFRISTKVKRLWGQ